MPYAYPTFYRAIEDALRDLESSCEPGLVRPPGVEAGNVTIFDLIAQAPVSVRPVIPVSAFLAIPAGVRWCSSAMASGPSAPLQREAQEGADQKYDAEYRHASDSGLGGGGVDNVGGH